MRYILGIDVGGTKTIIVVMDEKKNIIARTRFATHASGYSALQNVCSEITRFISSLALSYNDFIACGIGVPGAVDPSTGILRQAPGLIQESINVCKVFSDFLPMPLFIDNDVNMAAIGEMFLGGAKSSKNFIFLAVGTGLGAGIVVDGKLHRGSAGFAGEIGILPIDIDRHESNNHGGFGPMESMASGGGLERQISQMERFATGSFLNQKSTARDIFTELERGDLLAKDLVNRMTDHIAFVISYILALFDPDLIMIGGGVAQAGDHFISGIAASVKEIIPVRAQISSSKLGENAGAYGAAVAALRKTEDKH